jgi:hypothetical protein
MGEGDPHLLSLTKAPKKGKMRDYIEILCISERRNKMRSKSYVERVTGWLQPPRRAVSVQGRRVTLVDRQSRKSLSHVISFHSRGRFWLQG